MYSPQGSNILLHPFKGIFQNLRFILVKALLHTDSRYVLSTKDGLKNRTEKDAAPLSQSKEDDFVFRELVSFVPVEISSPRLIDPLSRSSTA